MELSGRFMPLSLHHRGNTTCIPRIRRQVGPQSQLDTLVKRNALLPCRELSYDSKVDEKMSSYLLSDIQAVHNQEKVIRHGINETNPH